MFKEIDEQLVTNEQIQNMISMNLQAVELRLSNEIDKTIQSLADDVAATIPNSADIKANLTSQIQIHKKELSERIDATLTTNTEDFFYKMNLFDEEASDNQKALEKKLEAQFKEMDEKFLKKINRAIISMNEQVPLISQPLGTSNYKQALAYYVSDAKLSDFMKKRSEYMQYDSHKRLWNRLGPMTIVDIVNKTPVDLLFDPYKEKLELKTVRFDGYRVEGLFKAGTKVPHGIGKQMIYDHTDRLYEGMFIEGQWNGFGRLLWQDGQYYIGEFRYGYYHGYGKLVLRNGQTYQGLWKYSSY